MRLIRAAGLILLTALALSACVPPQITRSPEEIAAERQANQLAAAGRFDQAAQAFEQLAANSPNSDRYHLQAAEAYRQEGRLDAVPPLLAPIRRDRLSGDEPVRFDLLRAEVALGHGDARSAASLTTQPTVAIPADLKLRLLELRARALDANGDFWGSAHARAEMDAQLTGLDQTQNRKQIIDELAKLGAAPLQARAGAMQQGDIMLPWIDEALSRLGVAVARSQPDLGQPVGTLVPGASANVREGYAMPDHVALLLPASGGLGAAAEAVREGFFAAYADAARNHVPRPVVKVYDSGGDGTAAVKAYSQAVADGARLVVGPLTRSEVAAVFKQGTLPVPLLALNHPDDQSLPADHVSEFGLLPETEGAQVADHMAERGLHTAYTIISTDDFAQRAAHAFQAELEARGGHVVRSATLGSSASYNSQIQSLGITGAAADAAAAGTPTDAGLFISMRPAQARLLMPQLEIAKVTLPVFGTSHIYAGLDDAGADADLDGVEFCDAPWMFDAQPGLPPHADIAAQLPAARGTAARLFAFGMDAWNLVPYLDWLRSHPGSYLPGASGQLTSDQFGRIRRVLVWAKFSGGLARPLSGNLQMDDVPSAAPPGEVPSVPAGTLQSVPATEPVPAAAATSGT